MIIAMSLLYASTLVILAGFVKAYFKSEKDLSDTKILTSVLEGDSNGRQVEIDYYKKMLGIVCKDLTNADKEIAVLNEIVNGGQSIIDSLSNEMNLLKSSLYRSLEKVKAPVKKKTTAAKAVKTTAKKSKPAAKKTKS